MTDDQNTQAIDLDLELKAGASDSQADTDAQNSDTEGALSVEDLDSSEPQPVKKSSKEDEEKKQINAWVKKIQYGDRTLEDLKNNKSLSWLAEKVEDALEPKDVVNTSVTLSDEEFEARYERIQSKKQYQEVTEKVKSMPTSYRNDVIKEAKSLISDGMPKETALKRAYSQVESKLMNDGVIRQSKVSGGVALTSTYTSSSSSISQAELFRLPQKQYEQAMERYESGDLMIIEE